MAASAVYCKAIRIPVTGAPYSPNGSEVETVTLLSNASSTGAGIRLNGGKYAIDVQATGFGTVTLQKLMPDGSTYAGVASGTFSANGSVSLDLSYGTYKVAVA